MKEIIRGYCQSNKAYYSRIIDRTEIVFGLYSFVDGREDGTEGEMNIVWEELDDRQVPYLHCFDDGWKILASFKDVLDKMAEFDNMNITPDEFCELLDECGFKDFTKYENPYGNK